MAGAFSRFTVEPDADGYRIQIEDDEGDTTELTATAEQLELIAETINEILEDEYEAYDDDGDDEAEED
ncbi:MAG: hypothetical protein DI623_00885 [Sphingomonas sanxanigenens]|uniref:Uncharacterized protein n=1 Tax=Sphingomonas sanxanigenens TaxID=397260 RepID=A0A2W5AIB8_9SPHN|nr:MAG: hypothetical protein DI623_00885 [Sphingomonas sanxanigenens]